MAESSFEGDWKGMTSEEVWGWYFRLAAFMEQQSKKAGIEDPLSPRFLIHFLQGKGKELTFDPPKHLRESKYIQDALLDHRDVYLSRQKLKGNTAGIVKRIPEIKTSLSQTKPVTLPMRMHALQEIPVEKFLSVREKASIAFGGDIPEDMYERLQKDLGPQDADIFTSLRAFQVESRANLLVTKPKAGHLDVTFDAFEAHVWDLYDFDSGKRLKLPNPDYQNPFKIPNPVAPGKTMVMTYHSNIQTLVREGRAHNFDVKSKWWLVRDAKVTAKATLTPGGL